MQQTVHLHNHQPATYSTSYLDYFTELTNEELKNITKAKAQFKEVREEVAKHVAKHSAPPERNFSEINRKQIQA